MTTSPATMMEAQRLIDARDYEGAIAALKAEADDTDAEWAALLGLAHFMRQEYDDAVAQYTRAVDLEPERQEWRDALTLASANAEARIDVFLPEQEFYDRDAILAPPHVPDGALPTTPPPPFRRRAITRALIRAGNALGIVATNVMALSTHAVGKIYGYHDDVWTNWYRRKYLIGILTLAHMRDRLNSHNLKDTYPPGALVGFAPGGMTPPPGVLHYRTADGSWNNLENPREGAAFTRFPRNVANSAVRPESGEALLTPNPRVASQKLLARNGQMKEVPFLNLLAAAWIQFQNHDWISHGENLERDLIEIPLSEDDPARTKYRQRSILVGRTQPDPTRLRNGETTPITFINEVTHWWDCSQIYGSDQQTVDRLRAHVGGKLRILDDGTLPLDRHGIEQSGMMRNWWIGLAMLHTLFAREHNAICDYLAARHPDWDDTRLFNTARLINAAVTAKIHSVEWTPAILPNKILSDGLHSNWYGLLTNLLRSPSNRRTVAPVNIRNPELGGVVGNPINKHGSTFGLTEEFVEVYRLHSLLPESFKIREVNGDEVEDVPFLRTRQAGASKLAQRVGYANLFYSFGNQHPGQLVLNNYPDFMRDFSIPGNPMFDMAAVDLLRARERGVPRYNEFRRQLGLAPLRRIEDLTDNAEHVAAIKEVYGEDVESIDLMVGTLAEGHRPSGFGFGETLFQIFILNATRRLQADRFYTDNYNEETYTKEGLEWIDRTSLKDVILRHYPELARTGLGNVTNAFEPWDTDPHLDPDRHPLRGFDKRLQPDPWLGDLYR